MKALQLSICHCGKYLESDKWKPYSDIKTIILKKAQMAVPKAHITIEDLKIPAINKEKTQSKLRVATKSSQNIMMVMTKMVKCTMCAKEGTNYFEAILQVRSANSDVLERSVLFIQERVLAQKDRGLFVNKTETVSGGFDLFLTSNKLGQNLARDIVDKFGGYMKVSPRLFSKNKQTSKNIYRLNIYVEMPEFEISDVLLVDGKVMKVEGLGKKIKLYGLLDARTDHVDYNKLSYEMLKKERTYVSKTYPQVEVINPQDFQSSMIKNKPKTMTLVGQSVSVVIHKGIYLID